MISAPTAQRQTSKQDDRDWCILVFSSNLDSLKDSEQLQQIKVGFFATLTQALRITFDLQKRSLETLLNASIFPLERRKREKINPVASERLDRIFAGSHLGEAIFKSRDSAVSWMTKPNKALDISMPVMFCEIEIEIEAKQVRLVLQALEWSGAT